MSSHISRLETSNVVIGTTDDCQGTRSYGWGDLNLLDEGKPGWLLVPFDTHLSNGCPTFEEKHHGVHHASILSPASPDCTDDDVDLSASMDLINTAAARLCDGLTAKQLSWRPLPEKWSIAQNLAHLRTTAQVFLALSRCRDCEEPEPGSL